MQAFDWSRVWEGDNVLVELTRQERAMLLQYGSNVLNSPSTFLTGYDEETDIEAINDFLMLLQFHLLDNPPISSVDMLNIDLFTINATPLAGVGTLAYNASTSLPFGYTMFTQNITLYGMEQPVWLQAGEYDYSGWCTQNSVAGNTSVALTDVGGVVDTIISAFSQVGTFGVRVNKTGSFTVPTNGFYKIVAGNVSAVSGNHFCNWTSHHIRQTS